MTRGSGAGPSPSGPASPASAVALGPIIGGLLLQHFSWSSVFWVNLPISITALILGYFFVPESKDPNAPRLDLPGALLSIATLAFLLFGIIEGPDAGWTCASVLGAFAIGLVALAGFIGWELHTDHPMLDMSFFKNPRFSAANTAITLSFFALFGSLFLMTQYWQFVHGYSPLQAGVRLVPYAAALMLTAPLSARLVERVGTKRVVTIGLLVIAGSLFALSFISADSSYLRVIVNMCVMSVGMGLTMAPATESVMGSLPREKAGVGSAVNDTTRQVGGALGVAVIGSIVASVYAASIDKAASAAGVTGAAAETARGSLGGALKIATSLGDKAGDFATAARDGFVSGLSAGLRLRHGRRPAGGLRGLALPARSGPRPAGPGRRARGRRPVHRRRRGRPRRGRRGGELTWAPSSPPPPTARLRARSTEARKPGRPRDARADRAILEATLDLVGETGLAGLTVDAVAARAGVSKATIYRRWDSKEALVLAAWHECGAQLPSARHGLAPGRSRAAVRRHPGRDRQGVMEHVFPQMLAAARVNKELGEDFDRFLHERRRPTREVLRRARDRGELAPDADLELIHDLLVGPITYRVPGEGLPARRGHDRLAHRAGHPGDRARRARPRRPRADPVQAPGAASRKASSLRSSWVRSGEPRADVAAHSVASSPAR